MFIKQIIVCGFKSYRDKQVIDNLFNGLNVIVGQNGSGKSNIFAAIEFALTMEYRYMKPETRNALLCEETNSTNTAYVEVMFDNTDRTLPVNEDTVTFRRVLTNKNDSFFVNGKQVTNAKKFLDFAGFTNPYFIVKQGKVHDLAVSTDAARLKIISDIVGTGTYDSKLKDCRESLATALTKSNEVETLMEELEQRKEDLEVEVAHQTKYMKLDQTKRAIEYVLHDREHQEIKQNVANAESRRNEANSLQKPTKNQLENVRRDIQIFRRDISELELQANQRDNLLKEYGISMDALSVSLVSLEQELEDLKSKGDESSSKCRVSQLEKNISHHKQNLQAVETELSSLKEPLENLYLRKHQLDSRRKEIADKEHRRARYKSATAYKANIKAELKGIVLQLSKDKKSLVAMNNLRSEVTETLRKSTHEVETLSNKLSEYKEQISTVHKNIQESKSQERNEKGRLEQIWRSISEVDQILTQEREHFIRLEDESRKCFGMAVYEGMKGIRGIIEDFKTAKIHQDVVDGYFGLVCENIQCIDAPLELAVETAAGKKLSHHIVQSKYVVQKILREFNARKLRGEVNFIPLEGLTVYDVVVPDYLRNAKPMLNVLEFDNKFRAVAKFIFGSTLLCDSLQTATNMMKEYKLQCVTIEGEKVSRVGVIFGGYIRPRIQKLELQRTKSVVDAKLQKYNDRKVGLEAHSSTLKEEYKRLRKNCEALAMEHAKLNSRKDKIITEIKSSEKQIEGAKRQLLDIERSSLDVKAKIKSLEEKETVLKAELNGDESEDEIQIVKTYRTVSSEHQNAMNEYSNKQKKKVSLEAQLQNLQKTYYEGTNFSSEPSSSFCENETIRINSRIHALNEEKVKLQKKINEAHLAQTDQGDVKIRKEKELDKLVSEEDKLKVKLQELCAKLESDFVNYQFWHSKLQTHNANSGKLGSVPSNLENYEPMSDKALNHKLKKVNHKLKDKLEINQKAVQQFDELTTQLNAFQERMKHYKEESKTLEEMLFDLENKKGEAMLNNVRVLQEQFNKIFCSIVPQGDAELVLYGHGTSVNRTVNIECDVLRDMAGRNTFEGVKVSVNFFDKQQHTMEDLSQLSGGQKAVVALCLILAIQTIDPVPFYLFDEVDQALDTAYRNSVAKVVAEMSEKSQFICTTFRKEFVHLADKVLGVSYQNKCSHVKPITATQALDFVENDLTIGAGDLESSPSLWNSYSTLA